MRNEKKQLQIGVAVLGASAKPERYSYKAVTMLASSGYAAYPINPSLSEIDGIPVFHRLTDVTSLIDTVTVYVSPEISNTLAEDIIAARPRRVIFNPGAENSALAAALERVGITVQHACTLVLLTTGQFDPAHTRPVTACAECVPCFIRQTMEALELSGQPAGTVESIAREVLSIIAGSDWGVCPPKISQRIQRLIRERVGGDPYRKMKKDLNRAAMDMLPELQSAIPPHMDKHEAIVRMVIGGNSLDAGAKSGMHMDDAVRALSGIFTQPFIGDWRSFISAASNAQRILYLADNAGEIVFDRLLIEALGAGKITVAVRAEPVINDAIMEDAIAAGVNTIATVITNGSDAPGTILDDCSPEFRRVFEKSDCIISKGQGNYETLNTSDRPIYFLFQVKCAPIAKHTGIAAGTMVIKRSAAVHARYKPISKP